MSGPLAGRTTVSVTVNGTVHRRDVEPRMHLADFLREVIGLTGTHLGCEQGVCGMCTVLLDGLPVKSCLILTPQADGRDVRTVESLGGDGGELSALQQKFHEKHALQCGFCTPAFLLVAQSLSTERISGRRELRESLSGVLCRCTGYRGIVDAVEEWLGGPGGPEHA